MGDAGQQHRRFDIAGRHRIDPDARRA
jgi:hypothetical protein